jgi:hypothetical protein
MYRIRYEMMPHPARWPAISRESGGSAPAWWFGAGVMGRRRRGGPAWERWIGVGLVDRRGSEGPGEHAPGSGGPGGIEVAVAFVADNARAVHSRGCARLDRVHDRPDWRIDRAERCGSSNFDDHGRWRAVVPGADRLALDPFVRQVPRARPFRARLCHVPTASRSAVSCADRFALGRVMCRPLRTRQRRASRLGTPPLRAIAPCAAMRDVAATGDSSAAGTAPLRGQLRYGDSDAAMGDDPPLARAATSASAVGSRAVRCR